MRIGVDLDDVLVPFIDPFISFWNSQYDTSFRRDDIHTYDLWKVCGVSQQKLIEQVYGFYDTSTFQNLSPYPMAQATVKKLYENRHDLSIVSARPQALSGHTRKWLAQYFPGNFSSVHLTETYPLHNSSPPQKKIDIFKELAVACVIEDSFPNAAEAGIRTLLYDQPWNKREHCPRHMKRVYSWEDIETQLQNEACL